jgi:hypothetical protein
MGEFILNRLNKLLARHEIRNRQASRIADVRKKLRSVNSWDRIRAVTLAGGSLSSVCKTLCNYYTD